MRNSLKKRSFAQHLSHFMHFCVGTLQSASNGHFWISKLSFFYINKFFGKTYINNVMTIAMKCQSAPSTLIDTFHIHLLLTIVHVIFWTHV